MKFFLIVFNILLVFDCVLGLTFLSGVKCGSKSCNFDEYCSDFNNLCQPCSSICDETHHNVDTKKCQDDCQSYLLYLYKSDDITNLKNEVDGLHSQMTGVFILVCLLILGLFIFFIVHKIKNKNIVNTILSKIRSKKKTNKDDSVTVSNISGKPDLRIQMPPIESRTPTIPHTPSTASTNISRLPTEDNTLDYAYDNPAMATTPSPNNKKKPHESAL